MTDTKVFPVIVGLGVGTLALIMLTRRAKAVPPEEAPPEIHIPTVEDILAAEDFSQLDYYYNLTAGLYTIGKIDAETYMTLYEAYRQRWYELIGGS